MWVVQVTPAPWKSFKIRLGLERLSSWWRIKLFQGQTRDLKFPYLGWNRFLCSQQQGLGHLGSMPQKNMQRTTNLFFLWLLPNGRWLGRYQSRRYDAADASWLSRNEVAVINLPSLYMVNRIKIYMRPAEETRNNWTSRDNLCRIWS